MIVGDYMKRTILFIGLFLILSFSVKAECLDDELNEWVNDVKVEFIPYDNEKEGTSDNYAYLISLNKMRKDILLKAKDSHNQTAEAKLIDGYNIMAIGGYTSLVDENITIYIYGAKDSACPNELIKTISYTVPKYNDFVDTEYCGLYPDADICAPYKNNDDVNLEEFKKAMEKYIEEHEEPEKESILLIIWRYIKEYALYAIVPIAIIVIVYKVRINNYIRKEREK